MSRELCFHSPLAFGMHWFATHPECQPPDPEILGEAFPVAPTAAAVAVLEPPLAAPPIIEPEHEPRPDPDANSEQEPDPESAHVPEAGTAAQDPAAGEPGEPGTDIAAPEPLDADADLDALLAELEAASLTLARVTRQDQEARSLAMRDLERYDAAVAAQRQADDALRRSTQERSKAQTLAQTAFADEARAEASQILARATCVTEAAARIVAARRAEVADLAARPEIDRLLGERRQQQAAEKARAAAARRAERLSTAVARVREALAAGRLEEAKSRLGTVASLDPNCSALNSLKDMIARRAYTVKVAAAEAALDAVRGELRQRPAAAIATLEALDVVGLPEQLSRAVFGLWLQAWADQCRTAGIEEPLRYAPEQGRGAVLARAAAGDAGTATAKASGSGGVYEVLGALGMGPRWRVGRVIAPEVLRYARPLR